MEQIKRPCDNCRLKRIKCDRSVPCQRCVQHQLQCHYPPPTKANSRSRDKKEWNQSYFVFKTKQNNTNSHPMKSLIPSSSDSSSTNSSGSTRTPVSFSLSLLENIFIDPSTAETGPSHPCNKSKLEKPPSSNPFDKLIKYYSAHYTTNPISPGSMRDPKRLMQLAMTSFRNSLPVWGSTTFRTKFAQTSIEVLLESLDINESDTCASSDTIACPDTTFWNKLFNQSAFKLHLVDLFFTYAHPFNPCMSQSRFYDLLHVCPPHLMSAVCFGGYQHHSKYDLPLWQYMYKAAMNQIGRAMHQVKLSTIQASLIVCRAVIHWGKLTEGWTLLANAIRMARALGLHLARPAEEAKSVIEYEKGLTWQMCLKLQHSFNNGKRRPPLIEHSYLTVSPNILSDNNCLNALPDQILDHLNHKYQTCYYQQLNEKEVLDALLLMVNYQIECRYILPLRNESLLFKQRHSSRTGDPESLNEFQNDFHPKIMRTHLIVTRLYFYLESQYDTRWAKEKIMTFHRNYLIIYFSIINGLFNTYLGYKQEINNEAHIKQLITSTKHIFAILHHYPIVAIDYRFYNLFIACLNCVTHFKSFSKLDQTDFKNLFQLIINLFEEIYDKFPTLKNSLKILVKLIED